MARYMAGGKLTQSRDKTNAKSSEKATRQEQRNSSRDSLENDPENEDPGWGDETEATTNSVGKEGRRKCSEECTGGKDGDNGRRLGGSDVQMVIRVAVTSWEEVFPVVHGKNTPNGSCIIAGKR